MTQPPTGDSRSAEARPRRVRIAALVGLVAILGASALILARGSGEAELDAEILVEAMNEADAGLVLGERLPDVDYPCPTTDEPDRTCGGELWQLSFEAGAGVAAAGAHGSGTLLIVEDAERAHDEWERCEQALTLVCYRAANAVMRFTEITFAERQRTADAVRALASE